MKLLGYNTALRYIYYDVEGVVYITSALCVTIPLCGTSITTTLMVWNVDSMRYNTALRYIYYDNGMPDMDVNWKEVTIPLCGTSITTAPLKKLIFTMVSKAPWEHRISFRANTYEQSSFYVCFEYCYAPKSV